MFFYDADMPLILPLTLRVFFARYAADDFDAALCRCRHAAADACRYDIYAMIIFMLPLDTADAAFAFVITPPDAYRRR